MWWIFNRLQRKQFQIIMWVLGHSRPSCVKSRSFGLWHRVVICYGGYRSWYCVRHIRRPEPVSSQCLLDCDTVVKPDFPSRSRSGSTTGTSSCIILTISCGQSQYRPCIQIHDTTILATKTGRMERVIKEGREVRLLTHTTRHHDPEDLDLKHHRRESLKIASE
jgi:hypothetical protein